MRALCRGLLIAMLLAGNAYAASPAGEVPTVSPEQREEQRLLAQLERARALNAELAAERKQLQQDFAVLEAQVATKKQLLANASASAPLPSAPMAPESNPWWPSALADLALLGGTVLTVIGLAVYWRRRAARKPA